MEELTEWIRAIVFCRGILFRASFETELSWHMHWICSPNGRLYEPIFSKLKAYQEEGLFRLFRNPFPLFTTTTHRIVELLHNSMSRVANRAQGFSVFFVCTGRKKERKKISRLTDFDLSINIDIESWSASLLRTDFDSSI